MNVKCTKLIHSCCNISIQTKVVDRPTNHLSFFPIYTAACNNFWSVEAGISSILCFHYVSRNLHQHKSGCKYSTTMVPKLFHTKDPLTVKNLMAVPHLIRFCFRVPYLITIMLLDVFLQRVCEIHNQKSHAFCRYFNYGWNISKKWKHPSGPETSLENQWFLILFNILLSCFIELRRLLHTHALMTVYRYRGGCIRWSVITIMQLSKNRQWPHPYFELHHYKCDT